MTAIRDELDRALADLPEPIRRRADRLAAHWELVVAWNRRINLTSIVDAADAAWLHYRDSLEVLSVLEGGPVVDMGSGAGYPGVPIAIAAPHLEVTLVEPRRKRASFLTLCKARLALTNVRVLQARSTDPPDRPYAALVTRATFSSEADLRDCQRWVAPGGRVIAMRSGHDAGSPVTHPYTLRGTERVLAIWPKQDGP